MRKKLLEDINPLEYDLSTNVSVSPKQQTDRLIQLGKGVYKDKISGKLLYNYNEMPTAEVVGHKKEKSINDNWQAAYAKGIPSGTMSADIETMNGVTGGAMNLLSPSQVIGAAIHSDRPQDYFLNLMKGNNGIVADKFAQEHPYYSMAINGALDAFTGRTLYNINYWNQTRPLATAIYKGIGKTAVEIPYNVITNNKDYINDIIYPRETIKAIKDGRYAPLFLTKSRAKTAFIKNQKRLQSVYDDAYNFNKKIEFSKVQPVDIEKQYKINIDNLPKFMKTDEVLHSSAKPKLYIDPLKNKPGQKFFNAEAYNDGNVHIPSRTSKHILTDPNSDITKHLLSHEINHSVQDIIPRYRNAATYDNIMEYYRVNELDDLANEVFAPIKKNSNSYKTVWSGSPREVQSEMAGLKYRLNNPANYVNQPQKNKDFIKDYISNRFYISKDEADKMLNDMSRHSFATGGYIPTRNKYKNGGNVINDKYKYNNWLRTIGAIKGWDPNEMANDLTYDYKLFYNLQPKEAKAMLNMNPYAHFTDIGKTALHPSFSDESYYSGWKSSRNPRGIIGGRWSNNGHRYTLSQSQIDNNWDIRNTINYLSLAEPNGVELRMPNGTRPYIDGAYFEKVLPQVEVIAKRKRK